MGDRLQMFLLHVFLAETGRGADGERRKAHEHEHEPDSGSE